MSITVAFLCRFGRLGAHVLISTLRSSPPLLLELLGSPHTLESDHSGSMLSTEAVTRQLVVYHYAELIYSEE